MDVQSPKRTEKEQLLFLGGSLQATELMLGWVLKAE